LDRSRNLANEKNYDGLVLEPLGMLVLGRMMLWHDEAVLFDKMVEVQKRKARIRGDMFNVGRKNGLVVKSLDLMRDDLSCLFGGDNLVRVINLLEEDGFIKKMSRSRVDGDLVIKVDRDRVEEKLIGDDWSRRLFNW
jgi:hypothetical protein